MRGSAVLEFSLQEIEHGRFYSLDLLVSWCLMIVRAFWSGRSWGEWPREPCGEPCDSTGDGHTHTHTDVSIEYFYLV